MRFAFDHNLGLISFLLVIAAAIGLVAAFYRRVFADLADRRLWILVALRGTALVLIVLLLYRPVVSYDRRDVQPAQLAILVDTSGSMAVADDPQGRPRLAQAQDALLTHMKRLGPLLELRWFRFDAKAAALKGLGDIGTLQAAGIETNLGAAVRSAVLSGDRARSIGAVVFTDGIDNTSEDAAAAVKDLGVPIHTVATGYDLTGGDAAKDVMLRGVECAPQLALNTQASVVALVEARGLKGRVVPVELVEKGTVVTTGSATLDDVPGVQRVELLFTPDRKGRHEYTVRIPKLSDETIEQNNQHGTSAVVIDRRLRVLYVEGGVRAEYGTLVGRFLAHDPSIEYLAVVQTRPGVFVQRTNISGWKTQGLPTVADELTSFDVFVIGDIDSRFLGTERLQLIAKSVNDGKGLVMLGGQHSFGGGGYGATPLAAMLPVELPATQTQVNEPFLLELTAAGKSHPVFSGIVDFFDPTAATAEKLPELLGCVVLDKPRPAAEVLAVHPQRGAAQGSLPVLAVQRYGKGRAAAFAADTTHRWYQVMSSLGEKSPYLKFWGQLLRWLAGKKETETAEPGLFVNTDKGFYEPAEAVELSAVLVGEEGRGVDDARLYAVFELGANDATPTLVDLTHRDDQPGGYATRHTPDAPGRYTVTVVAERGEATIAERKIEVQVGHPTKEFDRLDLDEKTLAAIADATGGRYVHVSRVERLFESLADQQRARRILVERRLYHPPLFWAAFVALVTAEWLLRRRYRLR